jgi:hypothetical protein
MFRLMLTNQGKIPGPEGSHLVNDMIPCTPINEVKVGRNTAVAVCRNQRFDPH